MKRHMPLSIAIACLFGGIVCIAAWILSYSLQVTFAWTTGPTHYQIVSHRGTLYVCLNHEWWRKEPFVIRYDTRPGTSPITQWPGMRIEHQTTVLGFTHASGEWVSPLMRVSHKTQLNTTYQHLLPGAMHYTITPTTIVGTPYWSILLLLVGSVGLLRIRYNQSPADCRANYQQ